MVAQIKSYKLGKAVEIDLLAGRAAWPATHAVDVHPGNSTSKGWFRGIEV